MQFIKLEIPPTGVVDFFQIQPTLEARTEFLNPTHRGRCEEIEIDRRYHSRDGNSQVGKVGLPPLKIERHSILKLTIQPAHLHVKKVYPADLQLA
jgi:hypothetical protein